MTTFSQLIDEMVKEIVRPDMVGMLPSFLNQTIREIQHNAQTNVPVFFPDNRVEELVVASGITSDGVFVWEIPKITLLQAIEAVNYVNSGYAVEKTPQTARLRNLANPGGDRYWYRSGIALAFAGIRADGRMVEISRFNYPRGLVYKLVNQRAITYNVDSMLYTRNTSIDPSLTDAECMDRATNWILQRHSEMLKEGVRAKAYKRMDQIDRAKMCYSQYESMRIGVQNAESMNFNPQYYR